MVTIQLPAKVFLRWFVKCVTTFRDRILKSLIYHCIFQKHPLSYDGLVSLLKFYLLCYIFWYFIYVSIVEVIYNELSSGFGNFIIKLTEIKTFQFKNLKLHHELDLIALIISAKVAIFLIQKVKNYILQNF